MEEIEKINKKLDEHSDILNKQSSQLNKILINLAGDNELGTTGIKQRLDDHEKRLIDLKTQQEKDQKLKIGIVAIGSTTVGFLSKATIAKIWGAITGLFTFIK